MTTKIEAAHHVLLATTDKDLGHVPGKRALAEARKQADREGTTVVVRDATTDKVLAKVKPNGKATATAKAKGKAKPAKATKAKPAKAKPTAKREPRGKTVKILELAARKGGVTPAELNKLTKWRGAPWRWLFQNPKGAGWCDRFGYKFEVIEPSKGDGRVAYKVTAKK